MIYIDYRELFLALDQDPTLHSGKLTCPFCRKKSFKDYEDGRAHCHNCEWSGDAIQFYADVKQVGRREAFEALTELFEQGDIKHKRKTMHEVVDSLSRDLEFLAWCRMYFAFYGKDRDSMACYQRDKGLSKSQLSKVINGHFELVSPKAWHTVLNVLRQDIDIKAFKRDINEGRQAFERQVVEGGWIESARKFR